MTLGTKKRGMNLADIMMYVAIAVKHARLMILLFCVSAMAGLAYYVYARPIYVSKAQCNYRDLSLPVDSEKIFSDSRWFTVQLQSDTIQIRTAKRLGLLGVLGNEPDISKLRREFVPRILVRFNSEKTLEITVFSYYPHLTHVWAEMMVEEFLKYRQERHSRYREMALAVFNEELTNVSHKLKEVLDSKLNFEETNEKIKTQIEVDQFKEMPRQIVILRTRLEAMNRLRRTISESKLDVVEQLAVFSTMDKDVQTSVGQIVTGFDESDSKKGPSIVVVPSMVESGQKKPWDDLERERTRLQQQIKEAGQVYLPAHPKMKLLNQQLEKVEKSLETELEVTKNRFNIEYSNLTSKLAELERKLPEYRLSLNKEQKYKQDFELSQSGQLAWNKIHSEMAKQVTAIDFAGEKERIHLQYIGITEDNEGKPSSPNKLKILLFSLAMGLGLAIAIPFLIEFLDHTVTNLEQAEQTFQIRGLGIVPQFNSREIEAPLLHLAPKSKNVSQLLENFRVIRTNLTSTGISAQIPQVIMIASSIPQEGKTVVSTNLAMSFAQAGEKTLLIDADLRRGRLHRCFGLRTSPGLSNVLVEKLPLEAALRPSCHENLTVLSCGKHLPGATELLGASQFAKLMSELRQQYQRIIVDTPPVLGLSETSLIQKLTDGVVFVVWSGHTPQRSVKDALHILQTNGANFFGFVLNRMDLSAATNYYNYYYYSSNYYESYQAVERV